MKEAPILFDGEMVRAILDGRKTQTRRPVHKDIASAIVGAGENVLYRCPLGQAGDRLWVRETFVQGFEADECGDISSCDENGNAKPIQTWYRADGHINWEDDGELCNTPWKPSIHMPRSASRITLEITDVRIERLQSISEADAKAEGIEPAECCLAHYHGFSKLWQNVYGSESWEANPWVWVIEFRRVEK